MVFMYKENTNRIFDKKNIIYSFYLLKTENKLR